MVAPRATDINIDPSCGKVVDTDRAFASSLGLDTTTASGGSIDHLDQYLPWWQHSPQINMDSGASAGFSYLTPTLLFFLPHLSLIHCIFRLSLLYICSS